MKDDWQDRFRLLWPHACCTSPHVEDGTACKLQVALEVQHLGHHLDQEGPGDQLENGICKQPKWQYLHGP